MLTVLQVAPELETGGVERTTVDVASALVRAGGRALVASAGGRLEKELSDVGGELIRLPMASKAPWQIWRNTHALMKVCKDEGVSLIHARSRAPAWSALWAARELGLPFVTTYHGIYNGRTHLKRFYNGVMARGDRIIANSQYTADHIKAMHQTPKEKIAVIPRGTDMERFTRVAVSQTRRDALLKSWGIELVNGPILLLVGRLTRWKGQLDLLNALALLSERKELGDVQVVLAGDAQGRADYLAELRSAISQAELEDIVHIVGHVVDTPAAYSISSLCISASNEPEAFGRVAVEAQAMGVPVIATDIGGARETVVTEPGEARTGWRVPPADPDAMADALKHALSLTERERTDMSDRAVQHARAHFDLDLMCARTLAVYQDLLESVR